jgi:hypothetical protein
MLISRVRKIINIINNIGTVSSKSTNRALLCKDFSKLRLLSFFLVKQEGLPLLDFLLNGELKVYPVGMSIRLLSSRSRTIICCGIELFIAGMLVCQYICGWRFMWA